MGETKQPDEPADFDEIYLKHYAALHRYAYSMVKDDAIAEDMIHNVFCRFIEKGDQLSDLKNHQAYLFRSVYNECMNHIKHQRIELVYQNEIPLQTEDNQEAQAHSLQHKELKNKITAALNLLPEQCRTVFQLSRYEDLKYIEIATTLNISVNTVEKHMVKALKRLRIQLEEYLPLLIFWLLIN
jgi:RNA polymerase sigma-70 factor (ECF subfamily)